MRKFFLKSYMILSVTIVLVLMFTSKSNAGEFAVSPMLIELDSTARSVQPFSFNLFGKSTTEVKLSLYDLSQLESGYVGFAPASMDNPEMVANWVELEKDSYRLRDGDVVTVNGAVKIPARASGTQSIAVMVEEVVPDELDSGINVQIRYAVILNVDIEGRYKRVETEFSELAVVEQDGEFYLSGTFVNKSANKDWLVSQVQLRDANNRLLERVEMKTQSAWQRADDGSSVFPGARVTVFGKITKPFTTGNYTVMVRNAFAGKSQPVYRDEIYLQEPQAEAGETSEAAAGEQVAQLDPIQVTPDQLNVEIRDNGSSFTSFYIVNNDEKQVTVVLPAELENAGALGIEEFKFFPETVRLLPRQKARVVLNQKHQAAVNYGNPEFRASIQDENGQEISPLIIKAVAGS